jgi:hypothetical protein
MKLQIMTTKHPRWNEFTQRLGGPEGCNFHDDPATGQMAWTCEGGSDKTLAAAILAKMGGIDVPASLEYFEENGGFCDCEILFNVAS